MWLNRVKCPLYFHIIFLGKKHNKITTLECWTNIFHVLNADYKSFDINKIISINLMLHAIDCIILYNTYKLITGEYTAGNINDTFLEVAADDQENAVPAGSATKLPKKGAFTPILSKLRARFVRA